VNTTTRADTDSRATDGAPGAAGPAPVARLSGVSLRYGGKAALDDVTLEIPAGRMVGLIGPDGVGKSSLLALVSGARAIQQGHVRARRHRRAAIARAMPRIAYMPQGLGKQPVPDAVGRGEPAVLRAPVRPRRGRAAPPHRRADAQHRPASVPRPPGRQAVRRHEAEARPVLRADPRSRPADPRRADHRRRSAVARAVLGSDRAHPRRAARHERAGRHRLHGRGARFDWLVAMDAAACWPPAAPPSCSRAPAATRWRPRSSRCCRTSAARHQPVQIEPFRPDATAGYAIEADGLTMRFGDFVAVDHVSLQIRRGEIFGFSAPTAAASRRR
jgi:ribosome-dependent ATPase